MEKATKQDQLNILAAARFALNDPEIFDYVVYSLNFSEDEVKNLQEKIESMQEEIRKTV